MSYDVQMSIKKIRDVFLCYMDETAGITVFYVGFENENWNAEELFGVFLETSNTTYVHTGKPLF